MIEDRQLYMLYAQRRFKARLKSLNEWKESLKMKNCVKCNALKWNLSIDGICWDCERRERSSIQHSVSEEQASPVEPGGFGFGHTEVFDPKSETQRRWWIR